MKRDYFSITRVLQEYYTIYYYDPSGMFLPLGFEHPIKWLYERNTH